MNRILYTRTTILGMMLFFLGCDAVEAETQTRNQNLIATTTVFADQTITELLDERTQQVILTIEGDRIADLAQVIRGPATVTHPLPTGDLGKALNDLAFGYQRQPDLFTEDQKTIGFSKSALHQGNNGGVRSCQTCHLNVGQL